MVVNTLSSSGSVQGRMHGRGREEGPPRQSQNFRPELIRGWAWAMSEKKKKKKKTVNVKIR